MIAVLPETFKDLVPLATMWAQPTEKARDEVRWMASKEEFAAIYQAISSRLDEILEFLDRFSLTEMPADVRRLYLLVAAYAEAAPHHELYQGSNEVPYSFDKRRFIPRHAEELS